MMVKAIRYEKLSNCVSNLAIADVKVAPIFARENLRCRYRHALAQSRPCATSLISSRSHQSTTSNFANSQSPRIVAASTLHTIEEASAHSAAHQSPRPADAESAP